MGIQKIGMGPTDPNKMIPMKEYWEASALSTAKLQLSIVDMLVATIAQAWIQRYRDQPVDNLGCVIYPCVDIETGRNFRYDCYVCERKGEGRRQTNVSVPVELLSIALDSYSEKQLIDIIKHDVEACLDYYVENQGSQDYVCPYNAQGIWFYD